MIGIQYTVTSFFFLLVGGLLAMLMRAQLAQPGAQFVDANTYNGLFSVHASLLIFLFVIPVFAGLGNFVIPLMIGAPDMAFPRLNALSYWLLPLAGAMMLLSFLAPGGAFADGWTAYTPLSTDSPVGQMFFSVGVQFAGASSIMTALNFLVTIITMRAPGMSFFRLPLLVWANFATSLLVVIATPFIAASQFFVLFDRALGFHFFDPGKGGDVLMYQHVFWFYSHPAVYIMMLPGFGIISEVIAVKSRKPIFGYRMMAFSLLAIVVLGFTVWAHHMFTSGMAAWIRIPMAITTAIIAVPTGHQDLLLARDAVARRAAPRHADAVRAGLSDHVHARRDQRRDARDDAVRHPRQLHLLHRRAHPLRAVRRLADDGLRRRLLLVPEDDRADVRRAPGQVALLDDVHLLQPDVRRRCTSSACEGMPRRVATYAAKFADLNLFISIASWLLGLGTLIFLYNMVTSWRGGPRAVSNPWRGMTLEWQVCSPPPVFNFDTVPTVVGGPYEYGVPGAVHGIFAPAPMPATVGAGSAGPGAGGAGQ